ncbi:MAG: hypothetical protein OXG78_12370 [Chloroflexi bacterium]|nr:hypothetical protein [Chloroflexota bacterium]
MHKRERLERAIAGEPVDRVPVALWRHWPGDDQRFADLARSTIDFQHDYNWDFVRVMPSRNFQVVDYGVQDLWEGDSQGSRKITKRIISRSLAWTELRPLPPNRGALSQQVECLRLIGQAFQSDSTPILQTIYSPLIQAAQMAGRRKVLRDMRVRPDRLRSGLRQLVENTKRFVEALRKVPGIAGIFLVTEFASHDVMSEAEYATYVLPYLQDILDDLPDDWWLNILQVNGTAPMLMLFADLPIQALNWDTRNGSGDVAKAKSLSNIAVCGGLNERDDLLRGTPALLSSVIREALYKSEARKFILAGSGSGLINRPISNIRAVRSIVEESA